METVAHMSNEQLAAVLFAVMETAPPVEGLFFAPKMSKIIRKQKPS